MGYYLVTSTVSCIYWAVDSEQAGLKAEASLRQYIRDDDTVPSNLELSLERVFVEGVEFLGDTLDE